ncbi:MAG: 30S ribosomal protein S18 [Bdellovibrionaceae bacterium]|nr:30S ribosomal protein S18 [Bdellovibrio sp.]
MNRGGGRDGRDGGSRDGGGRDGGGRDGRDGGRGNRDEGQDSGGREGRKSNVRSKYRTEYSGDHVFDYKGPASLTRFVGDAGKITPARISKLSLSQQKQVSAAVKKARNLALLPSGTDAYDTSPRPELISPVPFEA